MGWISAAIGIFSAGVGIFGAKSQKEVDKEQVELAYEDNLEKIRRRKFTQEQIKGQAKAATEAAGVLHSGGSTAQGVLDTMAREFRSEIDWMVKFGQRARDIGFKSARVRAKANMFGAVASGIQTGAAVYGAGKK